MPSLRQLEYLVAVADMRNFRRAAERANTSQPTLSEQLKALEHRLGAQLVERSRSGVVLTPLGRQVVEIGRRMLADADEIRALAQSSGNGLGGVLRLGLPPTIGPYLMPRVVPELHRAYPDLKLYVREAMPSELPRALEEGSHDLVITLLPVRGAELVSQPLFRESLYLVVAEDHPLAERRRVSRKELEGQDVLTLGPGHQLHSVVMGLCEEFGAVLRLDYEGTSLDTLREMVAMGLGVTFLPGLYVKSELARGSGIKVLELDGRSLYRTVGMVWRRTSQRQESFETMAGIIRNIAAKEFANVVVMV